MRSLTVIEDIGGDEALIRSLHTHDDGRDWSGWLVWRMRERRRISEHVFSLPPVRPQVRKPSIKPKSRKKRRRTRTTVKLTDF